MDPALFDLARRVGEALSTRGWMLATAESCTGGWIGQCVTMVAGSSAWYDRGFITYTNAAKMQMLGVSEDALRMHGAVSEATVLEMAAGALARSSAQVAVAVSGIAGPGGGSADKSVGLVCIGWAAPGAACASSLHFDGDRDAVRRQAVIAALEGVIAVAGGHGLS
ncbi:MAG: CinA family protein [Burkholderiales bacterium]|nr:CinA family protein [Burkholderiales bacterium]